MKTKSVKINAVLNLLRYIISILFPLITYPYASRILGIDMMGRITYGLSIITYFSLIGTFGVTAYAVRECSKVRNNREILNECASEIFTTNVFTTIIAYLLLGLLLTVSGKLQEYSLIILVQSISVFFTTLGIDWLNTVFEDFLFITVRSIIINLVLLFLLFVFVRDEHDYLIYAAFTVLSNAMICVSNLLYCRRYVSIRILFNRKVLIHLRSMTTFFLNAVAVTIYVSADTTMLGWMIGDYYVGLYAISVKVYTILKNSIAAIYAVSIPRLTDLYSKKNQKDFMQLLGNITGMIIIILMPIMTGMIMLAPEIIYVLGGGIKEYAPAVLTLRILSIAIVFSIMSGIVTQCVNVPKGKERYNAVATIVSAITNIVLNILFIPLFLQNGAAVTTVISELIVLVIAAKVSGLASEREYLIDLSHNLRDAAIGCVVIYATQMIIRGMSIDVTAINIILICITSVFMYCFTLLLLKNKIFIAQIKSVKSKMHFG